MHIKGHFSCTRAALREMIKQKNGRIINFSSRASMFGSNHAAYSTAKGGILGFTSALASEFREHGITVNAILPSARTKFTAGPQRGPTPKFAAEDRDNMPTPLSKEPECVAPIVVYLATDEAKSITGRFIYASGGDICIYARALQLPGGAHILIRKIGKWSVDELGQVIPTLFGQR